MTANGASVGLVALLQISWDAVSQGRIPSIDILKLLLSKVLGLGIIAGASFVKVPQILALTASKSAEGLSELSFELENIGYTIHAGYGFILGLPFSTYGEAGIMLLQNVVLLGLVYKYARVSTTRVLSVAVVNIAIIAAIVTGQVSPQQATMAYDFNNVIFTAARVPQIIKNFQAKSTGQLSIVTYIFNTFGCLARMYTSHAEGGGFVMIRGFALGLVLNLIIALQIILYGNKKDERKGKSQGSKKKN